MFSELRDLLQPRRRGISAELLAAIQRVQRWQKASFGSKDSSFLAKSNIEIDKLYYLFVTPRPKACSWADSVPTCSLLALAPWRRYLLLTCASRRGKRARIILLTTTRPSVVIQSHPPLFHCSVKQILLPITAPYTI